MSNYPIEFMFTEVLLQVQGGSVLHLVLALRGGL